MLSVTVFLDFLRPQSSDRNIKNRAPIMSIFTSCSIIWRRAFIAFIALFRFSTTWSPMMEDATQTGVHTHPSASAGREWSGRERQRANWRFVYHHHNSQSLMCMRETKLLRKGNTTNNIIRCHLWMKLFAFALKWVTFGAVSFYLTVLNSCSLWLWLDWLGCNLHWTSCQRKGTSLICQSARLD